MYLLDPDFFFLRLDFFTIVLYTRGGKLLYYEWEHKRNKKEEKKKDMPIPPR